MYVTKPFKIIMIFVHLRNDYEPRIPTQYNIIYKIL